MRTLIVAVRYLTGVVYYRSVNTAQHVFVPFFRDKEAGVKWLWNHPSAERIAFAS